MIELRTLGTLSLHSDDGAEIRAILVQPKRLALLAYLALKEPIGFHQRSSLLAVFWPESDETRARLSLRSALHALRGALGNEVVVGLGDEGIALDPERFRCDAVELERALADGRLEDALPIYGGPLLDGLSVTELPAFDEWLEARRSGLRRRVAEAAMELGTRREQEGRPRDALALVRRAGELAPHDERVIRREMSLLASLGDRAIALTTLDEWSARLRRDLDVEPSPETIALAERLRASPPAARPAPIGAPAIAARTASPGSHPTRVVTPTSAATAVRAKRRRVSILAGVLAVVVALVAMAPFWMRGRPAGGLLPRSAGARVDFARGMQFESAGEYRAAFEAYREVVAAEPRFAPAYYGMSVAAQWAGPTDTAQQSAAMARRLAAGLSAADRASLPAWQALLDVRLEESARLYEAALKSHPDDARSWQQLGELRYHWGSAFGIPWESAIDPFQRVLRNQPASGPAFIHLARLVGRARRVATFDSLIATDGGRTLSATERLELLALRSSLHDDAAARVRLLGEAVAHGPNTVAQLAQLVAPIDTGLSAALSRTLFAQPDTSPMRVVGFLVLANLEAAHGRVSVARAWLDSLAFTHPAPAAEHLAALATLPWLAGDGPLARQALSVLEALPPQRRPSLTLRGEAALNRSEVLTIRRLYLTALLRSQLGDSAGAERDVRSLETLPTPDATDAVNKIELAGIVRAGWALQHGDASRALSLLGAPGTQLDVSLGEISAYPKARRRFLRAEVLERLGRPLDAVAWYSTFPDPSSYDIAYVGPALLGASRGYARLGNPRLADSLAKIARERWSVTR